MIGPQKTFAAVLVLIAFVLPLIFQMKERAERGGCFGYTPLLSIFFSIPLIAIAIVTLFIGKYKLWVRGKLAKFFLVNLCVYLVTYCVMMLIIYDFEISTAFENMIDLAILIPMHLGAVVVLTLLIRWIFGKMAEKHHED